MAIQDNIEGSSYLYDILIIGGGPAALSASIYASSANLKVGFIEKLTPGGKIVNTHLIQNYPGLGKISGADLALKMFNQTTNEHDVEYIYGDVIDISNRDGYQIVSTEDGQTRYAKALIIATGMKDRKLNIQGEEKYFHKGISYCAVCDGALAKNKNVAIIGGGNSAFYNAVYLSSLCEHITIINRTDKFKADEKIIEVVRQTKNITILTNTVVEAINGNENNVTSLTLNSKGMKNELNIDYVFIYIGFIPSTEFIPYKEILNNGFIITDKNLSTKIPGVFAAGDVVDKKIRQITTAVNDGSIAALSAIDYIKENWK